MATQKFLDQNGLQTFWKKIKTTIADQVSAIQGNAVLKTGAQTMAGPLTSTNGFVGDLTGKADTAGTADKTKASLTINVINTAGATNTTTFDGSTAQSTTIDMSALATDAELNAVIESKIDKDIKIHIGSNVQEWSILRVFPFTSERKRMSVIAENKSSHKVYLFMKVSI